MALLLKLWSAARALLGMPGAVESLTAIANAARARDAALVRAHAERLATIAAAKAANRL
jgi:hypothetical protein